MIDSTVLWKLYDNDAYDSEYKTLRARDDVEIPENVKQIYNPTPEIIDMDMALVTKGLEIRSDSGDCEALQEMNDWDTIIDKFVLYALIDGKSYLEIVREDAGKVYFIPLNIDEVSNVEYDAGGNIISADVSYANGDTQISRKYTLDSIEITVGDETEEVPNTWDFVPIFEYIGHKGRDDAAVSRVQALPPILDEINGLTADLKAIIKLHADPIMWGDVHLDAEENADKEKDRQESNEKGSREMRFVNVPEGGKIDILEMKGNIAKLTKEERDSLLEELKDKFPETLLAKIAAGSGVSGFAVKLKLAGLLSIIEKFRAALRAVLKKVMKTALEMAGFDAEQSFDIHLEEPLPTNSVEDVSILIQAYGSGAVPLEVVSKRIAELMNLDEKRVLEMVKTESMLMGEMESVTDDDTEFQSYNQKGMKPSVSEVNNQEG